MAHSAVSVVGSFFSSLGDGVKLSRVPGKDAGELFMPSSDIAESSNSSVAEVLAKLGTDPKTGLSSAQLGERLSKDGPNALPEEKKSALAALLAYFWGPIPWMIEAAALMALIVRDWGDFT